MSQTYLEHSNITVKNADVTAALLCTLFDWKIRWSGPSIDNGRSVHVGGQQSYVALYTHTDAINQDINTADSHEPPSWTRRQPGNLNHLGLVVDNLDLVQDRINKAGLHTFSHHSYEPGRRFYFRTDDNLEIEVVSYADEATKFSFWELASLQK